MQDRALGRSGYGFICLSIPPPFGCVSGTGTGCGVPARGTTGQTIISGVGYAEGQERDGAQGENRCKHYDGKRLEPLALRR